MNLQANSPMRPKKSEAEIREYITRRMIDMGYEEDSINRFMPHILGDFIMFQETHHNFWGNQALISDLWHENFKAHPVK